MGTSLSGLTPATTFDGLLKVGDNDPLTATLKPISTGDGTDTMLELSTSALQIGGATGMYWDNTNKRLGINNTSPAAPLEVNGEIRSTSLIRLMIGGSNKVLMQNANTVINSDVAIGQAAAPSARLHIKGSGATSATTSLLVQNSTGSELFKVQDDGRVDFASLFAIGTNIYGTNSSFRINIASSNEYSTFDGHIFKTYDGTAYSEAMRITGNTNQFVGIGETTPTARLHVKGSGNTNTTTSLLVQNSDAADILKVTDDGTTQFISKDASASLLQITTGNTYNGFKFIGNGYSREWRTYSTGTWFADSMALSSGFLLPTAKLQVKGTGATSATFALKAQNSGGETMFSIRDDKTIQIDGSRFTFNSSAFTSYADILLNTDLAVGTTTIAANTRAHIKGSGNTATTTALLVQNSDTTPLDLFKILDDGTLVAPNLPTSATGLPTGAIYNDAGTLKIV